MRQPRLVATRGLPAAGKSRWAREWVAEAPTERVRVNRDDMRRMLHGGYLGTVDQEAIVTAMAHAAVTAALVRGRDVVCDDTNLTDRHVDDLHRLARRAGAGFEVHDMTGVDVELCVRRDAARPAPERVGEYVIRRMWQRHLAAGRPAPAGRWPRPA